MTLEPISAAKLAAVTRLSTTLAESVLVALDTKSVMPPEPAAALADAAIFFHGHRASVPPVVMEALDALAARAEIMRALRIEPPQAVVDLIASGLSRMIDSVRLEGR